MDFLVFIAVSLDGFIARADGALDWLPGSDPTDENAQADSADEGDDHGYTDFIKRIDVLVMGRKTFEKVLSFGVEWPYGDLPVVVLSNGQPQVPPSLEDRVQVLGGSPQEVARILVGRGYHSAYLDGGVTIQRFLAAGLVTELTLTRIPVLIGAGLPLFGDLPADIPLRHVGTRSFANGLVQSTYAP